MQVPMEKFLQDSVEQLAEFLLSQLAISQLKNSSPSLSEGENLEEIIL